MKAESLLAFARQNMETSVGTQSHEVWGERVKCMEQLIAVYEWQHWVAPAWIKDGWVAMDRNGTWRWYEDRPTVGITSWISADGGRSTICLEGPPCNEWTTSLRKVSRGQKVKDRDKTEEQLEQEIRSIKAKLAQLYTAKQKQFARSK